MSKIDLGPTFLSWSCSKCKAKTNTKFLPKTSKTKFKRILIKLKTRLACNIPIPRTRLAMQATQRQAQEQDQNRKTYWYLKRIRIYRDNVMQNSMILIFIRKNVSTFKTPQEDCV